MSFCTLATYLRSFPLNLCLLFPPCPLLLLCLPLSGSLRSAALIFRASVLWHDSRVSKWLRTTQGIADLHSESRAMTLAAGLNTQGPLSSGWRLPVLCVRSQPGPAVTASPQQVQVKFIHPSPLQNALHRMFVSSRILLS